MTTLASKDIWTERFTVSHYSVHNEIFLFFFLFISFLLNFILFYWEDVLKAEGGYKATGR